jgi:hypothetical protein
MRQESGALTRNLVFKPFRGKCQHNDYMPQQNPGSD